MAEAYTAFPLTGRINLLVRLGHGSVTVTARDDIDEATVRLTPRDRRSELLERTAVEMRGPTLAVMAPRQGGIADALVGWRRDRDRIDAEIVVPSGTATKITTASADIIVKGRIGGADLVTGSATIEVDTVDGDLRLRYGSATSSVQRVTGSATVRSGAGNASFGEVVGVLQAGFGSGDLAVDVAYGGVRSRAGSGDAHIGVVHGDVDLAAGSGGVSIGLPAGISARLEVTTGSGRVQSELPIEQTTANTGKSITIKARTGSGDVRLFRAA
ncbi:MAG TPA: hypothetical protein VFE19_07090 [Jatrophihabitantaceae bacterium]|jgi:hypothetical protein|nr:hypothetical protein [Jatrophihabitantaceae bacterium]